MEVRKKQRRVTEFFHEEEIAAINIRLCSLNAYRDQTVDVSTVRQLVVQVM
jgi:hypothetical protein